MRIDIYSAWLVRLQCLRLASLSHGVCLAQTLPCAPTEVCSSENVRLYGVLPVADIHNDQSSSRLTRTRSDSGLTTDTVGRTPAWNPLTAPLIYVDPTVKNSAASGSDSKPCQQRGGSSKANALVP
ncbi:hypothetical protein SprV_0200908900 [Sparganum proliferum]